LNTLLRLRNIRRHPANSGRPRIARASPCDSRPGVVSNECPLGPTWMQRVEVAVLTFVARKLLQLPWIVQLTARARFTGPGSNNLLYRDLFIFAYDPFR
jgi:hypothetical protein